ncbi:MAG: AraC family transcriptional regulator, partial [Planctomycetota bacterium]|nr:AraC family transcriptional regulator [Planctomycetota bacterium]
MEVLRPDLSGTFFMSCTGGLGQVLIDGQWRSIGAKMACLQPPFIANGLRATKDSSWSFCWVRYREMARSRPIASPDSPTLGKFDSTGIHTALQGLFAEAAGAASAPA